MIKKTCDGVLKSFKHYSDALWILVFLFFSLLLFHFSIYVMSFQSLDSSLINEFIKDGLKFQRFLDELFSPLLLRGLGLGIMLSAAFLFSWLVNKFVVTENGCQDLLDKLATIKKKLLLSVEQVGFTRTSVYLIFKSKVIVILRISVIATMIAEQIQRNTLSFSIFIFLAIYLLFTVPLKNPDFSSDSVERNRPHLFIAITPIFMTTLFTLLITYEYKLDLLYSYRFFIVILLFSEILVLLSSYAVELLKSDLKYAKLGKNPHVDLPQKLSGYIIRRNKKNLNLSLFLYMEFLLILCGYFIFYTFDIFSWKTKNEVFSLSNFLLSITAVLFARLLSRSIEIVVAFFKDILSKEKKSSDLDGKDRMLLAVKSLIEIMLLAAIVRSAYNLYSEPIVNGAANYDLSHIYSTVKILIVSLFESIATMGFNLSYEPRLNIFEQIIHLTQIIVSISLITLSIATYISFKQKVDDK
ncbi:hypothetical protein [Sporosarcina ureae]|uniref:hypothetical protein n=1 Tax=Sporosarcina ureae TaxID=1571 RepID=UPI000A17F583|nr:hypothetical protein [Sporosarcina ureae]ARK22284.1 hypothetical protein SporoP32a_12555 [Sporosarcina ureae]